MTGKLFIEDLEVSCIVGAHADERLTPQTLLVSISLEYDIAVAAKSDLEEHVVDFSALAAEIRAFIQEQKFFLLERLTVECCGRIAGKFPVVERVTVAARKPKRMAGARSIGIEYTLDVKRR